MILFLKFLIIWRVQFSKSVFFFNSLSWAKIGPLYETASSFKVWRGIHWETLHLLHLGGLGLTTLKVPYRCWLILVGKVCWNQAKHCEVGKVKIASRLFWVCGRGKNLCRARIWVCHSRAGKESSIWSMTSCGFVNSEPLCFVGAFCFYV
jgi:hypothetical protein